MLGVVLFEPLVLERIFLVVDFDSDWFEQFWID